MDACEAEWQERLSAWFDGEVDAQKRRSVALHVEGCVRCAGVLRQFESLRRALRGHVADEPVPSRLRDRVTRLAGARQRPALSRPRLLGGVAAMAASLALLWGTWPGGMNEALAMDLERHHLKAFSRVSPCEFESSDPAAVEAWARREVGYPVTVPRVPGATLLGARRCRLHGQLSVSLLYRVGDRAMTLFIPPAESTAGKEAARFAEEGPRCTQGPVGEKICVAPAAGGESASIAVSEVEEAVLLEALNGFAR